MQYSTASAGKLKKHPCMNSVPLRRSDASQSLQTHALDDTTTKQRQCSCPVDPTELHRRLETYRQSTILAKDSPKESDNGFTKSLPYVPRYADRHAPPEEAQKNHDCKAEEPKRKRSNRHSYHTGSEFTYIPPTSNNVVDDFFANQVTIRQRLAAAEKGMSPADLEALYRSPLGEMHYSQAQARQMSLALLESGVGDQPARSRSCKKPRPKTMTDNERDVLPPRDSPFADQYAWDPVQDKYMDDKTLDRPKLQPHDRHNWEQASQAGDDARDLLHLNPFRRTKSVKHSEKVDKLERITSAPGSSQPPHRPPQRQSATETFRYSGKSISPTAKSPPAALPAPHARPQEPQRGVSNQSSTHSQSSVVVQSPRSACSGFDITAAGEQIPHKKNASAGSREVRRRSSVMTFLKKIIK